MDFNFSFVEQVSAVQKKRNKQSLVRPSLKPLTLLCKFIRITLIVYGDDHMFEVNERTYNEHRSKIDVDEKHHCENEEKDQESKKPIKRRYSKRERKLIKKKDMCIIRQLRPINSYINHQ